MQTFNVETDELVSRILANGGITVNLADGSQPKDGFAVSIPGHEERFSVLTEAAIAGYISRNADALTTPWAHFGAWFNVDDGTWYLDTSLVVGEESTALKLGARWGQKAIYDFRHGLSLHVPQWLNYTSPEQGGIAQ